MTNKAPIKVIKYELYATPLFIGSHSVICPVCGVGSNIYPCFDEGDGTAVLHRLTYCNHLLESKKKIMLMGEGIEL